jgi:hypothetical protein
MELLMKNPGPGFRSSEEMVASQPWLHLACSREETTKKFVKKKKKKKNREAVKRAFNKVSQS